MNLSTLTVFCLALLFANDVNAAEMSSKEPVLAELIEAYDTVNAEKFSNLLNSGSVPDEKRRAWLSQARPEDKTELTRLLAKIKKSPFQFGSSRDQFLILNKSGAVEFTVARGSSEGGDDSLSINGNKMAIPEKGSLLGAIRAHLKGSASLTKEKKNALLMKLAVPGALANSNVDTESSILPIYLYHQELRIGEWTGRKHSPTTEAKERKREIGEMVTRPSNSAMVRGLMGLIGSDVSVQCKGSTAEGRASIAGTDITFESRENGEVLMRGAHRHDGNSLILTSDRKRFQETVQGILEALGQREHDTAVERLFDERFATACNVDLGLRTVSAINQFCFDLKKEDIHARTVRPTLSMGPSQVEEFKAVRLVRRREFMLRSENRIREFARSLSRIELIGMDTRLQACIGGRSCENRTTSNDGVYRIPPKSVPSEVTNALEFDREDHKGIDKPQTYIDYSCKFKDSTCAWVSGPKIETTLSGKDLARAKTMISEANIALTWDAPSFLNQARALRPLGKCCADTDCRLALVNEVNLIPADSSTNKPTQ